MILPALPHPFTRKGQRWCKHYPAPSSLKARGSGSTRSTLQSKRDFVLAPLGWPFSDQAGSPGATTLPLEQPRHCALAVQLGSLSDQGGEYWQFVSCPYALKRNYIEGATSDLHRNVEGITKPARKSRMYRLDQPFNKQSYAKLSHPR